MGWAKDFVSLSGERAGSTEVVISGHVFPGHKPEDVSLPLPLTLSLCDRDQVAVLLLEDSIELTPSLMKRHPNSLCPTLACLAIKRPPLPRSEVEAPSPPAHPNEESPPPAYDEPPPPYSEEPPPAYHNHTVSSSSVSTGGRSTRRPSRRPSRAPPLPPGHFTAKLTPGFDVPKGPSSVYSSTQSSSNDVPSQIFTEVRSGEDRKTRARSAATKHRVSSF